jgi:hypothetical protein
MSFYYYKNPFLETALALAIQKYYLLMQHALQSYCKEHSYPVLLLRIN